MFIKNVKLSVCLPFITLCMNPAVVLVRDIIGTDWHVTSHRLLSIVYWRQIPFAANALIISWAIEAAI